MLNWGKISDVDIKWEVVRTISGKCTGGKRETLWGKKK